MAVSPKCGTRNYILYYILISIAYLHISHFLSSAAITQTVCKTPECQKLAEYYTKIQKTQQQPCEDFYDYVCHNWGTYHPKPGPIKWTVKNQLELNVLSNIRKLLEEKRKNDTKDEAIAKSVYATCMNLPSLERMSTEKLKNITYIVGNRSMFSSHTQHVKKPVWQHVDIEYIKISGESALFSHFLGVETRKKSFAIRPVIHAMNSPYGILKRDTKWDDKDELKNYKLFLHKLIQALAPHKEKKDVEIEADVDDVIKFREELRHVIADQWNNYMAVRISKFQKLYDSVSADKETAKIDWLSVVRAIYNNNSRDAHDKVIDSKSLIKIQPEYFKRLSKILANTKDSVIMNHIHLYFAERHVQLTPDMDLNLEKSVSNSHHGSGRITLKPERWAECVANKEIQITLGQMYLKSHFSHLKQSAVSDMILLTNSVLQKQISQSNWVSSSLQTQWIKFYSHLDTQIGYPKWYFNKTTHTKIAAEDVNPIKADIHYSINNNRIGVSAAYLQWPIYDPNLPPAVQYGALLPAVGRELYRKFNYTGLDAHLFDFRNNKLPPTNYAAQYNMSHEFQKHVQCFTDIYNMYDKIKKPDRILLAGSSRANVQPQKVKQANFPLIVNKVIPEMMGLKLAYTAYKEKFPILIQSVPADSLWKKIKGYFKSETEEIGNCTALPGLEEYNCDQLFFVAYASSLCENSSPTLEANVFPYDAQSPTSVKVNLAVSNMPEFRKAFACSARQYNDIKECDLWK